MRVFLVVEETSFYHPDFVAALCRETRDEIVGAALVVEVPPKNNIETYLRKHWHYLRPVELARLAGMRLIARCKDALQRPTRDGPFYSVRSTLRTFDVPFFEVRNSINRPEYLDRIRAAEPDVILSSQSLIFEQDILDLPRLCCINRHSALLPAYGGLWPVFQAFRCGEHETGVTVHSMERSIDTGIPLAQRRVPIEVGAVLGDLYEACFRESVPAVLDALDKIRAGDMTPCAEGGERSYFSFPTEEHWREFRKRGGRFI
jgi:methionyl-tRNA formyltransferase